MTLRDQINRVMLRGEVDKINRGREHIAAMQERDAERNANAVALRRAPTVHPHARAAARERLRMVE